MKDANDEQASIDRERPTERDDGSNQFKVFLGGIPRTMEEEELFTVFRKYKPVDVMVMREAATKRSRGFAFITFSNQKDMDHSITDLHNTRINGRLVTVSKARPFERPRDRSPTRGGHSSPYRRREYRRSDYDDRYHSSRRSHQNDYQHQDRMHYPSNRDGYSDGYHSRRGADSDTYGGYSQRRNDRRSPHEQRGGQYGEDRRDWRHPGGSGSGGGSAREGRRTRWRSHERVDDERNPYPDHRRRDESPDRYNPNGGASKHRGEVRRVDAYSRNAPSERRMP